MRHIGAHANSSVCIPMTIIGENEPHTKCPQIICTWKTFNNLIQFIMQQHLYPLHFSLFDFIVCRLIKVKQQLFDNNFYKLKTQPFGVKNNCESKSTPSSQIDIAYVCA